MVSDCCRAAVFYTARSPSFWECSKCKLTCKPIEVKGVYGLGQVGILQV